MEYGPQRYAVPVEAEVVEERRAIVLEKNQGIYVRDLDTGVVRIVKDQTYMLKAHEELAEKQFEERVQFLVDPTGTRDKFRAYTITLKHNEAMHIYKE
jgi:major vault protein